LAASRLAVSNLRRIVQSIDTTPWETVMQQSEISANPFALMMDPEAVLAAVNRSDRLLRLKSRICRPLDKPVPLPLVPGVAAAAAELKVDAEDDGDDSDD
jgi:hypothetical protein